MSGDEELILIEDLDAVALELSGSGIARGDGIRRFLRELRVGRIPDPEQLNVYMRGLRADDRMAVIETMESLRRETPNLTEYEVMLISLGMVGLLKGNELEVDLLQRAINGEEFTESDASKVRLLDTISRKQQNLMNIVRKANKERVESKEGLLRSMSDDEKLKTIRLRLRRNISVEDAEYELVSDDVDERGNHTSSEEEE